MEPFRFVCHVQFLWNNIVWTVDRILAGNEVFLFDAQRDQGRIVSIAELEQALFTDALRFVLPSTLTARTTVSDGATTWFFADMESIPPAWYAIAEWRLKVIEPLVQPRVKRTVGLVQARVEEMQAEARIQHGPRAENQRGPLTGVVSISSVYRWIRLYETGGRDLRALVPRVYLRGGVGVLRIPDEVEQAIQDALRTVYLRDETTTIVDAYYEASVIVDDLNRRNEFVTDDNTGGAK